MLLPFQRVLAVQYFWHRHVVEHLDFHLEPSATNAVAWYRTHAWSEVTRVTVRDSECTGESFPEWRAGNLNARNQKNTAAAERRTEPAARPGTLGSNVRTRYKLLAACCGRGFTDYGRFRVPFTLRAWAS
ncbi:MAG TPA: hypothetical protein VE621_07380 [Bryobacteraceae bacterium]|nr:hypothetical protein [Bryobacteraceae bacterium]